MSDRSQGKVTGHGEPAAPPGGPRVPDADVDRRTAEQWRPAAGQLQDWPADPLGVESRGPRASVMTFERPMGVDPVNTGEHGVILPPDHPSEGEQRHQLVYPTAPLLRREPGSWAEPLMRDANDEGEAIPGAD